MFSLQGAAPEVHFPGMMVASGHCIVPPHPAPAAAFSLVPSGVGAVSSHPAVLYPNAPSAAAAANTPLSSSSSSSSHLLNHHFISAENQRLNGTACSASSTLASVQQPVPGDSASTSMSVASSSSAVVDQKSIRGASAAVSQMSGSRYQSIRIAVVDNKLPNGGTDGLSPSSTDSGGSLSPATTPSSRESTTYRVRSADRNRAD